jgi:hypothetical protein
MRGFFTVGFRALSRSGANRWTSDIWRAGNSTEPTEIADPIALSFPCSLETAGTLRFQTSKQLASPIRAVSG